VVEQEALVLAQEPMEDPEVAALRLLHLEEAATRQPLRHHKEIMEEQQEQMVVVRQIGVALVAVAAVTHPLEVLE
jgi:hypothetical protein